MPIQTLEDKHNVNDVQTLENVHNETDVLKEPTGRMRMYMLAMLVSYLVGDLSPVFYKGFYQG